MLCILKNWNCVVFVCYKKNRCLNSSVICWDCCLISVWIFPFQSDVIKTRSTESLSFVLIFANFLVAILWTIYGGLIKDIYLQVWQTEFVVFCTPLLHFRTYYHTPATGKKVSVKIGISVVFFRQTTLLNHVELQGLVVRVLNL